MIQLIVHDRLCEPATPARRNEDAFGAVADACFVFDGATGLGGERLVPAAGSDAAWLAETARDIFLEGLAGHLSGPVPTRELVGLVNRTVAERLDALVAGSPVEDWAWPIAGFEMIRILDGSVEISGLGDCVCHIAGSSGQIFSHTPLPGMGDDEAEKARAALARLGGLRAAGQLDRDPATRDEERAVRAGFNRPGSKVWTLGRAEQAADHVSLSPLPFEASGSNPAFGIVCSDGFGALIDKYRLYDPASLIAAARGKGLGALYTELRTLEASDPDALKFPRFKQGDDATAVLFELR